MLILGLQASKFCLRRACNGHVTVRKRAVFVRVFVFCLGGPKPQTLGEGTHLPRDQKRSAQPPARSAKAPLPPAPFITLASAEPLVFQGGPGVRGLTALVVDRPLTIQALPGLEAVLDANGSAADPRRVLTVLPGAELRLVGVTLRGDEPRLAAGFGDADRAFGGSGALLREGGRAGRPPSMSLGPADDTTPLTIFWWFQNSALPSSRAKR